MRSLWTPLSGSARGSLHESAGRVNQDAVLVDTGGHYLIMAVADGHGSSHSFRSDRGAAFATEAARSVLAGFMLRHGSDVPLSGVRRQMTAGIPRALVEEWKKAVRADLERDPFSPLDFAAFADDPPEINPEKELPFSAYLAYGATLIATLVTRRFIAYLQLGDGDILLVDRAGMVSRPWPRDHAFFNTHTVSLCSHHADEEVRVAVFPCRAEGPALILLATDGYANCFADENGFATVGTDFLAYLREHGADFVQEKLNHWLGESSRDGSRDDITVALAVRNNGLRPATA
jgi:serine/threonine protein phosphatase PrpC